MKKIIVLFLAIAMSISLCCGCTSQYDKDLQSGINKMKSGGKMTQSEKNATNDFLNWQKNH